MNIVYMVPFFLNSENNDKDFLMVNELLYSLELCEHDEIIFYNQGYISNQDLDAFLSGFNIKYSILGEGKNVGITASRYMMIQYIKDNIKDCKYVAEAHLDMIFTPGWEKPLIDYLERTIEPFVAPRIVYYEAQKKQYNIIHGKDNIDFSGSIDKKIEVLENFKEDKIVEGFVHPVIHKFSILKEINPYDVKFLTGGQGYEDDSILLGYSYYLGTKLKWRPKINFNSCVFHRTLAQRLNMKSVGEDIQKNLKGLLLQYGSYGQKELARIHGNRPDFKKNYERKIIDKYAEIKNIYKVYKRKLQ